jgi:type I restriction enzyme, S subunit
MAGEWDEAPFADVIDFQEGPGILAKDFREHGVPLVRLAGLDRGESVLAGCNYLEPESVTRKWSHFALEKGDILLSTSASLGRIAVVGDDGVGAIAYTGIIRMRPRNSRLVTSFIRYLLEGPEFQRQAEIVGAGSVIRHFGPMHLRQMTVRFPPLFEQRAIAHILGTLDDKIELNRRMSETLEAMARALFKSWFVDFDPVRAKAEGRDPGLPKPLADLFRSRLVDSELGEIPEGWEVDLAGNIFDVAIGKTPPRKEQQWFSTDPLDIPWMSIKDLGQASSFISDVSEYLTADAVERFRVRKIPDGTVVLSFKLTVGRVAITDGAMLSNEAIAHFLPRGTTFLSAAYLYCYLRQFDFNSLGSTSSIATAVNSDSVRAIRVLVPSKEIHEGFLQATSCLFGRLRALQRESRTLAGLRDALLPKLISGDLRVADAAATAEALT